MYLLAVFYKHIAGFPCRACSFTDDVVAALELVKDQRFDFAGVDFAVFVKD